MALPVRRSAASPLAVDQRDPFRDLMEGLLSTRLGDGQIHVPQFDIEETEDAWIVEADLPGVRRKDMNVEVRDGELLVSGEIKERERTGILRHRTRRTGEFEIRVALPGDVDTESVDASVDHGVLKVTIPKPERAKPRRIDVASTEEGAAEGAGGAAEGTGEAA
jgi:HSP20 family protein